MSAVAGTFAARACLRNEGSVTFWTSESLRAKGPELVEPFDPDCVVNCSIELRLGSEGYVTGGAPGMKTLLAVDGGQLVIPPGQFALLLTEETICIPNSAIGFISMKSRFKLHGLMNVSGFHVDPGFQGKLIFSVYNAGGHDVVLSRSDPMFLLWLSSLEAETDDPYDSARRNQTGIPNSDIMAIGREHYSTAAFNDRLSTVETRLAAHVRVLQGIGIAILVGIALLFAQWFIDRDDGNPAPTPTHSITTTTTASQTTTAVAGSP